MNSFRLVVPFKVFHCIFFIFLIQVVPAERSRVAIHDLDVAARLWEVSSPPVQLYTTDEEQEQVARNAWSVQVLHRDNLVAGNVSYEQRFRERLERESGRLKALSRRVEMKLNKEKEIIKGKRQANAMASSFTSFGLHSSIKPPQRTPVLFNFGQGRCPFPHICKKCNKGRKPIWWKRRGYPLHVTQAIKLVETYDGSFQLEPESEKALRVLLSSELFCNQVAEQSESGAEGSSFQFTGELFKPVPWSVTTKHGMPQIFSPSRLCAVFKKVSSSPTTDV